MRKFEKFLFFYSIAAITALSIAFGVFSPNPLNLISGILLTPLVLYFWLRLTSPQGIEADVWSVRFIIALILLSGIGIYGFYLSKYIEPSKEESVLKAQLAEALRKNEELAQKTPKPTPTMEAKVEGESVADLIFETPKASVGSSRIALKSNLASAFVYKDKDAGSMKVGSIVKEITYPFIEKSGGWYKIVADAKTTGWVSASDVSEVW